MSSICSSLHEEHCHLSAKYGNPVAFRLHITHQQFFIFIYFMLVFVFWTVIALFFFFVFWLFLIAKDSSLFLSYILASACLMRLTACAFYQPVHVDMSRCLTPCTVRPEPF